MLKIALVAVSLIAVGCGGSGGPGLGGGCSSSNCAGCCLNNVCQPGSTAAACGKNASSCVACLNGAICKTDQTCGVDPNSMWKVQPLSATIRTTDSGGVAWDALGGAPDPYCDLYCPGTASAITSSTAVVADTFSPVWSTGGCVMKASDLLTLGFKVGVYDEDVSSDDTIAPAGPISVAERDLLAGRLDGISNGTTLTSLSVGLQRQ